MPAQVEAGTGVRRYQFFRSRLQQLTVEEIEELCDAYQKDCLKIREDCYKLAWSMRGAISLDQALMLSYDDRNIIAEIYKENLETTKKSGLPFF